jgi:hypothetical protein
MLPNKSLKLPKEGTGISKRVSEKYDLRYNLAF